MTTVDVNTQKLQRLTSQNIEVWQICIRQWTKKSLVQVISLPGPHANVSLIESLWINLTLKFESEYKNEFCQKYVY